MRRALVRSRDEERCWHAGDIAAFGAVYRFCHDTVQPPLPEYPRILAEYMKWMPEACRMQAMSLCRVLIKE